MNPLMQKKNPFRRLTSFLTPSHFRTSTSKHVPQTYFLYTASSRVFGANAIPLETFQHLQYKDKEKGLTLLTKIMNV